MDISLWLDKCLWLGKCLRLDEVVDLFLVLRLLRVEQGLLRLLGGEHQNLRCLRRVASAVVGVGRDGRRVVQRPAARPEVGLRLVEVELRLPNAHRPPVGHSGAEVGWGVGARWLVGAGGGREHAAAVGLVHGRRRAAHRLVRQRGQEQQSRLQERLLQTEHKH